MEQLTHALRTTGSRSKRALLDRAADTIEALLADLETACRSHSEPCEFCKHAQRPCCGAEDGCMECSEECPCKICCSDDEGGWVWRGIKEERGSGE